MFPLRNGYQEGRQVIEGFSYDKLKFDDGRGKYPEEVKVLAPLGTRAKVKRIAQQEGITASELIRRAVFSYLDDNRSRGGLSPCGARA
jgi:hypothetical protein